MKGNQGISGQEALFAQHGYIIGNIVQDAGGDGIHVEQPSAGTNKNRHITVRDNIIIRAGFREGGAAGIRVNRCIAPVISGNKVLEADGNGVQIRLCENVTGDIYIETFGTFGLFMDDCDGWDFSRVTIIQGGTATADAIRESSCDGTGHYGRVRVEGGGYLDAFRSAARNAVVTADSMKLETGSVGQVRNDPPMLPTHSVRSVGEPDVNEASGTNTVDATGRDTIINVTGPAELIRFRAVGDASARVEVTIDGGSVEYPASLPVGSEFVFDVAPRVALSSMLVEINNNYGSPAEISYEAVWRYLS